MPFALNDTISLAPLDGGIEITDLQYEAARAAKLAGREALVIASELVIRDPAPSPNHTWEGGKWVAPAPDPEPSFPELKAAKLADLENKRWEVETGGMAFAGVNVPTHRDARSVVTAAYIRAIEDPDYTVPNYKVGPATFITLDATAIIAYALALEAHVQAAFDREAELAAEIVAAADEAALEAIDISAGWPG